MPGKKPNLNRDDFTRAFAAESGGTVPPILTPRQLADLLQLSVKTLYEWIARGRLDGAFRKRGKHIRFWRDRALDIIFNGKDWS